MSKSLTPAVRRRIVAFDPSAPDSVSVSEFCRSLGISRPSFYAIRRRFRAESNAALNPRSRAPKRPARRYTKTTERVVLDIRRWLKSKGWDAGPKSVWHTGVDDALFAGGVPSVSTIARILAAAGVVDANPRKRPRSSYIRFHRAAAMEMWQLDAFEYVLFDVAGTMVTVYQLVDDSTRLDVGTAVFTGAENGTDAIATVGTAITAYGVPQELLSDNGTAFNQSRRGAVAALERFLARKGCLGITGRYSHPMTQGKNERSHQTLQRFLDAHQPDSRARVAELLTEYRQYYNQRRHHQSLPGEMTPAQAWDAADYRPSDGRAIPLGELQARVLAYQDRAAARAQAVGAGQARAEGQYTGAGRLRELPDEIVITRQRAQIYLHGRVLRVPQYLAGRYALVITATDYMLFDVNDGTEVLGFPLPITTRETDRTLALWQVHGARIRDPKPNWLAKHVSYEAEHYTYP